MKNSYKVMLILVILLIIGEIMAQGVISKQTNNPPIISKNDISWVDILLVIVSLLIVSYLVFHIKKQKKIKK